MRGWTLTKEVEESETKAKIRAEMIGKLAAEWNEIKGRMEQRSWASPEEREDENDYWYDILQERLANAGADGPLSKEAEKQIKDAVIAERRALEREDVERLEVTEELLYELGARMMRPYEHWNEEERYMEFMEDRYSYSDEGY